MPGCLLGAGCSFLQNTGREGGAPGLEGPNPSQAELIYIRKQTGREGGLRDWRDPNPSQALAIWDTGDGVAPGCAPTHPTFSDGVFALSICKTGLVHFEHLLGVFLSMYYFLIEPALPTICT